MKLQVLIEEPLGIERKNEPVHIPLTAEIAKNNICDVTVKLENKIFPAQVYTDFNNIKTAAFTISCNRHEKKEVTIEILSICWRDILHKLKKQTSSTL